MAEIYEIHCSRKTQQAPSNLADIAAVIEELESLLAKARRGETVGLAYVEKPARGEMSVGAAGDLGHDHLKAAGALMTAAISAAQW